MLKSANKHWAVTGYVSGPNCQPCSFPASMHCWIHCHAGNAIVVCDSYTTYSLATELNMNIDMQDLQLV